MSEPTTTTEWLPMNGEPFAAAIAEIDAKIAQLRAQIQQAETAREVLLGMMGGGTGSEVKGVSKRRRVLGRHSKPANGTVAHKVATMLAMQPNMTANYKDIASATGVMLSLVSAAATLYAIFEKAGKRGYWTLSARGRELYAEEIAAAQAARDAKEDAA